MNKQHVLLPNRKETDDITPRDQLIYVTIKRFMNNETLEAFPSLATISEKSGASINTIRESIQTLVKAQYISIRKEGRKNVYRFNPYKLFEPFSYEFLDKEDLTFGEKAFVIAVQQHMFKYNGYGCISYSTRKLAKLINISDSSVSRYINALQRKKYLCIAPNKNRDAITGCSTNTLIFDLNALGQLIIEALCNLNDRLKDVEEKICKLQEMQSRVKHKDLIVKL